MVRRRMALKKKLLRTLVTDAVENVDLSPLGYII